MKGKTKKHCGIALISIGIGIIICIVIPIWGWLLLVGGALVYAGWYLIEKC
ncbi:MAG: hypothetical protein LIR50_00095 [Bacillota bacterium]|nr:hypothetical protein [Bacillota bacterium]